MVLNIYERGKIKKTFKSEAYDLPFGIVEDVASLIDVDAIGNATNAEIIKVIIDTAIKSKEDIKALFLDIFPDMTADDLKKAKLTEMAAVLHDVVTYTISETKQKIMGKN